MKKPFVVRFTITYRNSILVFAEDAEMAETFAGSLYDSGEIDPEDNGYDGCEVDSRPASEEDVEDYKYDTYDAEEKGVEEDEGWEGE